MTKPRGWNDLGSPVPDPPAAIYPQLPRAEQATTPDRPLRVCIVSNGILGPIRNGGISTLYMGLAETLVEAGHDVTYLYTAGDYTEERPVDEWVEHYRGRGIRLVPLPEPRQRVVNSYNMRTAYATFLWLEQNDDFDVIHFHEWQGHGYYCLVAKRQGLAFAQDDPVREHAQPHVLEQAGQPRVPESGPGPGDRLPRTPVALACRYPD